MRSIGYWLWNAGLDAQSLRARKNGLAPVQIAKAQLNDFVEDDGPRREEKAVGTFGEPTELPGAKGGSRPFGVLKLIATSDGRRAEPAACRNPRLPARRPLLVLIEGGAHSALANSP
jgi:hypothetical protein